MAIRKFLIDDLDAHPLTLPDEQATHARRVLRIDVGHHVQLLDGKGHIARARVTALRPQLTLDIEDIHKAPRLKPWIDLAVAIPKGDRADTLIDQASQLGADRLIPIQTDRGVVKLKANKLERFRRIAAESAKQCGRAWLMEIGAPTTLSHFLQNTDHDGRYIADLADEDEPAPTLPASSSEMQRMAILIGPEGGWTDAERQEARAAGFQAVSLGPHVMRVETAAAAALAIARQNT